MAKSGSKADAKRKHVEERDSEDRFRILADDAPALIWVTGPDGSEFVNRAYREFVGVSSEVDVLHFDWTQYVHPDDRDRYLNEYLDCFRRQVPFNAVLRFRRHDGMYRWMKSIGKPRYTSSGEFYGYVGSTQDITDVKTAEEALRESESRFRTLADNMSQLAWMTDEEGRIFWYNNRWFDYTGTTLDEMEGWGWQKVHHPDHVQRVVEKISHSFKTGEVWEDTFPLRGKDGNYRWFLSRAMPIRDQDGKTIRWFGTNTDITERRQMEEEIRKARDTLEKTVEQRTAELHESKERYRALVEMSPDAIIVHKDGRFLYANRAALRLHGADTLEQLQSRSVLDTIHPDDRGSIASRMGQMARGEIAPLKEARLIRPDGHVVYFESTGTQINYGGETAFQVIARDITERKRAEEILGKLRYSLEKSQEIAHLGSWELDLVNDSLYWSDEAYRIFGMRPQEFGATYEAFLDAVHPNDRAAVDAAYSDSLRKGKDLYEIEHRVVRKSTNEVRWVHEKCQHIRNGEGNIIRSVGMVHDITERKQADDALRESEEKFRLLADTSPAAIFIYQDGRFVYLNPATEQITGYHRDELIEMAPWEVIHPDYRGRVEKLASLRAQGIQSPSRYETKLITKDGGERWMDSSSVSIVYKNKPAGLLVAFDITERKLLEERLAHVASFPELNPMPVFEIDEAGAILYSNPAAKKLFPDLHTMGMNHPMLMGIGKEDFYKDTKDGRVRDVQVNDKIYQRSFYYLSDKHTLRIYMIDITERKRAEEKMRKSEANLAKAQRIAHVGSYSLNTREDRAQCSDEFYNILGLAPMDYFSLRQFLTLVHREDREVFEQDYRRAISQGKTYTGEFRIVNPDGEIRHIYGEGEPIFDDTGKTVQMFGIIQDITDSKNAEMALKEEKAQAELYLDLMGHDINNMHQIAMGYLELIEGMVPDDDPRKELLEKPSEVLQRSAQLIKNVRKLQKLREGVFLTQDVDVCQLLVDAQREFGSVPHKAISLNLNDCGSCHVRANELLYDVFANLVSNAIKHTGDRANINIGLDIVNDNDGRYCRVSVDDNGPGIPDNFKGVIFNRLLNGTNQAKGMGLGLYLVKSLVESYGGRVWVEDRVKGDHTKGARFVVMLPVADH